MFLVCGEALFDFFLESEDGSGAATYAARAGGLAVQRRDRPVAARRDAGLLTGLSDDLLGQRLAQVLAAEGVSTAYAIRDRPADDASASSASTPRACRPTSSTTTARPTPA